MMAVEDVSLVLKIVHGTTNALFTAREAQLVWNLSDRSKQVSMSRQSQQIWIETDSDVATWDRVASS